MKIKFVLIFLIIFSNIFFLSINTIGSTSNLDILNNLNAKNNFVTSSGICKKVWGSSDIEICTEPYSQLAPQICCDENNSAIIVWQDYNRSGLAEYDIYAQKIDSKGQIQWTLNGLIICNADSNQMLPEICNDGDGGAIITWKDYRNGNYDIYAQNINSQGLLLWDPNGTVICNAENTQENPKICCDDLGGAIITWEDNRNGTYSDIYAQYVNSSGIQWGANGTVICNENYDQIDPQICSDGAGGAIIAWKDERIGGVLGDIYVQKINSSGTQWVTNGTLICNAEEEQKDLQICRDESGGAIITWFDDRGADDGIYAQKINSTGAVKWDINGTVICNAEYLQSEPKLCSDGVGGAIITWQDKNRTGTAKDDIYAQKVNSSGHTQWEINGTVICNAIGSQMVPEICCNGNGGAFICWRDTRATESLSISGIHILALPTDIYGQLVSSEGNIQWGSKGAVISALGGYASNPKLCCGGSDGAIVTWYDTRNANYDIFAQKIINYQPKPFNWGLFLLLFLEQPSYSLLIFGLVIGIAIAIGFLVLYLQEK